MNGRMYDPVVGRMLSTDNNINGEYSTQGYDRYSYALNNPLKYTDPDGEWVHIAIGAVIGGAINWGVHGFKMNAEGAKAFGIGALAGGIGAATGGVAFTAFGGGAGGAGGFIAGGVSGMTSAGASMPILSVGNNIAFNDPLMTPQEYAQGIVLGGIMGGLVNGGIAASKGNNFWNGNVKPPTHVYKPPTLGEPRGEGKYTGQDVPNGKVTPEPGKALMPGYDGYTIDAAKGSSRILNATTKQLQRKYLDHAADFGLTGNWNKTAASKFSAAINQHINSPGIKIINGTYRGQPAVHYLNPNTGLNVISRPNGQFWSGWKLGSGQLQGVLKNGTLW